VSAAGARAADELGAQGDHCWSWWIRLAALWRDRCLRLVPGLLMSSAPWVATSGAGDPVRGIPAGPVPAVGARAADLLDVRGGYCRCG